MYYACIKSTSKYYNSQNTEKPFPVELNTNPNDAVSGYIWSGGPGGIYRTSDLDLFVMIGDQLVPIKEKP